MISLNLYCALIGNLFGRRRKYEFLESFSKFSNYALVGCVTQRDGRISIRTFSDFSSDGDQR